MVTRFYSAINNSFHTDEIDGVREISILDPDWERPLNDAGDPDL